jgi:hypothetical protein
VLEADRAQPALAGLDDLATLEVERLQHHALGALHLGGKIGHREAALVPDDLAAALGDHRVHEGARFAIGAFPSLGVHHDRADRVPDLRGREADAGLVVHRLEHVGRELAQLVGDLLDRLSSAASAGRECRDVEVAIAAAGSRRFSKHVDRVGVDLDAHARLAAVRVDRQHAAGIEHALLVAAFNSSWKRKRSRSREIGDGPGPSTWKASDVASSAASPPALRASCASRSAAASVSASSGPDTSTCTRRPKGG